MANERGSIPAVSLRIAGVYDEACHSIPLAQQIAQPTLVILPIERAQPLLLVAEQQHRADGGGQAFEGQGEHSLPMIPDAHVERLA